MSIPLQESATGTRHELYEELTVTQKKLQQYADTIVSLHGELRSLRESICNSCKRMFVPANLVSSNAKARAVDSSSIADRHPPSNEHVNHGAHPSRHGASDCAPGTSRLPISKIPRYSMRHSSPSQLPPSLPISIKPLHSPPPLPHAIATDLNAKPLRVVRPCVSSSIPKTEPSLSRWSAERDAAAETSFDVTFLRALVYKDPVQAIRFGSNGEYLAAGLAGGDYHDRNGEISVYSMEKDRKTCVLAEWSSKERPCIQCVCFSPDGRYLVVGEMLWDVPNKRIRNTFRGHKSPIKSVDFSPNGRLVVAASWAAPVHIWNIRDGSTKAFINASNLWSVRFSPNGQYVVAGNDGGVLILWDVRSGCVVESWDAHDGGVRSVEFTSDGKGLVSGCTDGVVKYWDVSSLGVGQQGEIARKILEYKSHTNSIYAVAISPDAEWIASGSDDRTAVIWGVHGSRQQCRLLGHEDIIRSVDFSPSGNYIALGSWDRHVTLWRYIRT